MATKEYSRASVEKIIYDTFDALDPTGINGNKYRELFSSMSDKQFDKYMKDFLENEDENFILDIVEFERTVDLTKCEKAAKVLGIPLWEYVYLPHLTMDQNNVVSTPEKCLVGYINVKRTQQLLFKKNGITTTSMKRSAITGQVIDKDRNSRTSDIESTMLVSLGAEDILRELQGPRADDESMQSEMLQDISSKGFVSLDDLDSNPVNKKSLVTLSSYLLSAGIFSDVLGDTYILPSTLEE